MKCSGKKSYSVVAVSLTFCFLSLIPVSSPAVDAAYTDYLDAYWESTVPSGQLSFSGTVDDLAAGASSSNLTVGLNTDSAGVITGTAMVGLVSDGTRFGLGETDLASAPVDVSAIIADAVVYRYADALVNNPSIDLGNLRQGGVNPTAAVSITNDVPDDGFSESLNANVASVVGNVMGMGSFALLGAGATDSSSIVVGLADTSVAGAQGGVATIDFESDGTGTSGLGTTALASLEVMVSADIFRLAVGTVDDPELDFIARVGDSGLSQSLGISNTALADGFSENLDATATVTGGPASVTGSIIELGAGDSGALQVDLDTSVSGMFAEEVDILMSSNGQEWGLGDNIALGEVHAMVNSMVFDYAEAGLSTNTIDFGTVRVGTTAEEILNVANTGSGGLVDDLHQTGGSVDAPFALASLSTDLAAGADEDLQVSMDTSVAGNYSGSAVLSFSSTNDYLSDANLADQTVVLTGTVNSLAEASFVDVLDAYDDATLSKVGDDYLFDFGEVALGSTAILQDELTVLNSAVGPADSLAGIFISPLASSAFSSEGFGEFSDLAAGMSLADEGRTMRVSLDTSQLVGLGLYSMTVYLNSASTLLGFSDIDLDQLTLTFLVNVVDGSSDPVPEPGTWMLLGTGLAALYSRRKTFCRGRRSGCS